MVTWSAGKTSKGEAGLWRAERAGALKGNSADGALLVLDRSRASGGPDTWGAASGMERSAPEDQ